MKTLVLLTVIGVCSGSYEANQYSQQTVAYENAPFVANQGHGNTYPHAPGHQTHAPGYTNTPKWKGPVAATVPAGVGGKLIPVGETPEVVAARKAHLQAHSQQLAMISSLRSRYDGPSYSQGGSAQSYSTPDSYNPPVQSYNPPVQSYNPPVQSYNPPVQSFNPVQSDFYGASQVYSSSSHGASLHAPGQARSHFSPADVHAPAPAHAPVHALPHAPVPVQDTPEVAGTRAQFFRLYEKQAAAAAAAPDDEYIPSQPAYHRNQY